MIRVFLRETYTGNLEHQLQALSVDKMAEAAAAAQLNRIRARFLAQEDTQGATWPVSKAALTRQATGRDGGTLFDTGTLFHSIGVSRLPSGAFSIGTDVPYAAKHQYGLEGMVRREFIGASESDKQQMKSLIATLIRRRLADG